MTTAPEATEVRLGELTGDRVCHACGFNLRGQTIVREPHYRMVMVRCPECGTPDALMELPRASTWLKRLGALAAFVWVLVIIAAMAGAGAAIAGLSWWSGDMAARPLAMDIARAYIDHAKTPTALTGVTNTQTQNMVTWAAQQTPSPSMWIDTSWWTKDRVAEWRPAARAASILPTAPVLYVYLAGAIPLLALGAVLACILPHVRQRRLPLVVLPVVALAAATVTTITIIASRDSSRVSSWGVWWTATDCARSLLGPWRLLIHHAWFALALIAGLALGRPLARWIVRWLVPPRQYATFSFLWLADDLPLPRPARPQAPARPHE